MRGPKGLASKFHSETVPNREKSLSAGKRTLLGSVRRNLALSFQHGKQTMSGLIASPYDRELGIVSPSNVTDGMESITNPGSTVASGIANRCLRIVNQVVKKL